MLHRCHKFPNRVERNASVKGCAWQLLCISSILVSLRRPQFKLVPQHLDAMMDDEMVFRKRETILYNKFNGLMEIRNSRRGHQ